MDISGCGHLEKGRGEIIVTWYWLILPCHDLEPASWTLFLSAHTLMIIILFQM